ncbi:MAG: hypothetical protein ACI9G1_004521, partial [Pirellulaceae bacterium]
MPKIDAGLTRVVVKQGNIWKHYCLETFWAIYRWIRSPKSTRYSTSHHDNKTPSPTAMNAFGIPIQAKHVTNRPISLTNNLIESTAMTRMNRTILSFFSLAIVALVSSLTICSTANAETLNEELCDCSPEITLILRTPNVRLVATLVGKAGGKVLYDPNLGIGNDIPFLVVTLPPAKMIDKNFIESLKLPAGAIQELAPRPIAPTEKKTPVTNISLKSLSVPIEDIKIPELRKREPGKGLGENTVVAIIDTGIDASHPVFQDRVAYWYDATREGRTILK